MLSAHGRKTIHCFEAPNSFAYLSPCALRPSSGFMTGQISKRPKRSAISFGSAARQAGQQGKASQNCREMGTCNRCN